MVNSADGIPGMEAVVEQRRLALLLSNNLKWEYLEMCGFVSDCMSLEIVRSDTLIISGSRDREAYILQRLDLADGEVIPLLVPWRG